MLGIGSAELAVILLIILFAVGPKKLPEIARTLGKLTRMFKASLSELNDAMQREPPEELKKEMEEYFDAQAKSKQENTRPPDTAA